MQRQDNHNAQDRANDETFQYAKDKYDYQPYDSNLESFEEDNYI